MKYRKVYFDLDGVLADFDRGVRELCGLEPARQGKMDAQTRTELFRAIRSTGHFYAKLELRPGAKQLFDAVRAVYGSDCEILSGIPSESRGIPEASADKEAWAKRFLAEDLQVNTVRKVDKPDFCTGPECVLIDDYEKNIRYWEEAGGTGILYESAEQTMEELVRRGILPGQR